MPEDRGDVRTHSSPRVSGYSQENSKRAKEHGRCLQTPFLRCNKQTEPTSAWQRRQAPPASTRAHRCRRLVRGRGVRSHNLVHVAGVDGRRRQTEPIGAWRRRQTPPASTRAHRCRRLVRGRGVRSHTHTHTHTHTCRRYQCPQHRPGAFTLDSSLLPPHRYVCVYSSLL